MKVSKAKTIEKVVSYIFNTYNTKPSEAYEIAIKAIEFAEKEAEKINDNNR